ncbi:hypothetical protein STANM337S_01661 [Streptomyces tanashiensis]
MGSVPARISSSACSTIVVPYVWEAYPVSGAYNGPCL